LIDGAIEGAERGATLTKRLLAFARRQELKPEVVDLRTLIEGMGDLLRRTVGATMLIDFKFDGDLPSVRVDPNQLELALLNLVINARDAMPDGGRVTIGAAAERNSTGAPELDAGEFVCISVADTGIGMDDATLKRATEPFFTTKGTGKGTGLGLSMVHGLAAQSGGLMRISSRPGAGTTVSLWLPVDRSALKPKPATTEPDPASALVCRVLVVDDDPLILASTAAMLEDIGHLVVEASSAARALEVLRLGPRIDLIITDQVMPGMTGIELVRQVRRDWPGIPVILSSGYADLPASESVPVPRMAKPYQQAELAACIATVLGGGNVVPLDRARRA
jgi:CheY-like chemotaxis protein